MSKSIYEMFNDSNIDLNFEEVETFNDIEKQNIKRNFKKKVKNNKSNKKFKIAMVMGLLIVTGLFGTNMGKTVLAEINIVSVDIASKLGINKNLDEYKTVIDKSVTKNGITIKLNEVILNENELIVSTTLKSQDKKMDESDMHSFAELYINGKQIKSTASGSGKKVDEYTMEEVISYRLDDDSISGDIDVKIKYRNVLLKGNEISGPWTFEFKTNGDDLAIDTNKIKLAYNFKLDDMSQVNLKEYTSNNIGEKIYYTKTKSKNNVNYDLMLKGTDDLGNKIEFYMSSEVYGEGVFKRDSLQEPLSKDAKILTLTPYASEFPKKSGKLDSNFVKVGETFVIDLINKK